MEDYELIKAMKASCEIAHGRFYNKYRDKVLTYINKKRFYVK